MSTQTRLSDTRSNILGVTGLSRAVLADLFRRRGLFGRDSQLSASEQAVVQSRLPAIPGITRLPVIQLPTRPLKALADYVETLVAGGDADEARSRVIAAGLSPSAANEAAITVDNVRTVFGPIAVRAAAPQPVSSQPQYARAA